MELLNIPPMHVFQWRKPAAARKRQDMEAS
jgi:hypothetical protein